MSTKTIVLLRYPKPTQKPRFFAETVHRRNLGFSAIIDGFWAHLQSGRPVGVPCIRVRIKYFCTFMTFGP